MKRLTDTEILQFISSGGGQESDAPGGRTLSGEDRQRCDTLREVWVALDEWKLPEREVDLWPRIEAMVHRLEGRMDAGEYARRSNGALKQLWGVLDEWRVPDREADLWPRIAEAVNQEPRPQVPRSGGRLRRILAAVGRLFSRSFDPRD
jgi:hypothetical protein